MHAEPFPFHVAHFLLRPLPAPELRRDPVLDRWVLVSTERARRPLLVREPPPPTEAPADCPFCPGNESQTPHEVLARRPPGSPPDSPGWSVRVVPNRYPAAEGDVGRHEVVIDCPQHTERLTDLPPAPTRELLDVWRERLQQFRTEGRWQAVLPFKNVGAAAGASLMHSHAQIVALPIVPTTIRAEIDAVAAAGHCLFCELIRRELDDGSRVVRETPGFVALTAYAGRFPFESWLLPKFHAARFEDISPGELNELSEVLYALLKRLDERLDRPAYNYYLHTAPLTGPEVAYHWHLEVTPRLTGVAGFEWGGGMFINPVPPEQAAAYLRE
jgi:UDPglucose--hexose-1-phosphate uridylyltransferase